MAKAKKPAKPAMANLNDVNTRFDYVSATLEHHRRTLSIVCEAGKTVETKIKVLEEAICPRVAARLTALERHAMREPGNAGLEAWQNFGKPLEQRISRLERLRDAPNNSEIYARLAKLEQLEALADKRLGNIEQALAEPGRAATNADLQLREAVKRLLNARVGSEAFSREWHNLKAAYETAEKYS